MLLSIPKVFVSVIVAPTCHRFAAAFAASLFAFVGPAARAQTPTPAAPPATTQDAPAVAASGVDLALMRKAFAVFDAPTLQTETTFVLDAKGGGVSFTARVQLNVVAKRAAGKKFRANVALVSPEGLATTGAKYVVVSDGAQVFTHRPGANQYSAALRKSWDAGDDDLPVLGLFASTYLDGFLSGFNALLASADDKTILDAFRQQGLKLSGEKTGQNGVEGYVFTLDFGKTAGAGPTYRLFVEPATGALKQLELKTREKNLDVTITETVARVSATPGGVTAATFAFAPPAGTKKVKTLVVEVFPQ